MSWQQFQHYNQTMSLKRIGKQLTDKASDLCLRAFQPSSVNYNPTPYLTHPLLQSIYTITEAPFQHNFQRQKVFFEDGGHISLDWSPFEDTSANPPILFVMHGLTGGSEMNYMKAIVTAASKQGYCCVCLNSRGINNEMTSPIPFTAVSHTELQAALDRVTAHYPNSPIYIVGTSFGGNYLLRHLIRNEVRHNIKGLVTLAAPIDVSRVVKDMGMIYQRFFVKRYIEETVLKHPLMKYWEDSSLVDFNHLKKSTNLSEFHGRLTVKLLGYDNVDDLYNAYTITPEQIANLQYRTLMIISKDDPIVSYASMPFDSIASNRKITLKETQKGGHLCWFEGIVPKRWYPKPILDFFRPIKEANQ